MPDLLLELFSEEIPARMQVAGAKELERLVVGALSDRGLMFEGVRSLSGPRRLALAISGLPGKQPDTSEERKGPRVDAPQKAIDGFLRAAGVTLDQCTRQSDPKGDFYVAVIRRTGRATNEVLKECLPQVLAQLPWPKSMRWPGSDVRWVRPLHGIVCTFDGEIVPFAFAGVASGNTTVGHRFLSSGSIEVRHVADYEEKLRGAYVILDAAERKDIIVHEIAQKAFAQGLEWIRDDALLEEVAGLAEWPVVLVGRIEHQFMDVPAEILQSSMRTHQKYFAFLDARTGKLAPSFAVVANMVAGDDGAQIVAGNERVLRARLSDAKFFWDQDRKIRLESRLHELKSIVFHAGGGTMEERAYRIALSAMVLAARMGTDVAKAGRAGLLAKTDLVSGVVGEFPELQGIMGGHYALHDGDAPEICAAIRDHYKPIGPSDAVPGAPISAAVALADKLDSLVVLWRAGEKPTGSKDPFALRRAALGIIRILLANGLRLPLLTMMRVVIEAGAHGARPWRDRLADANHDINLLSAIAGDLMHAAEAAKEHSKNDDAVLRELLEFFADRLKVALRERGTRHDLIDAVFSIGEEDDLVRLVARVEALGKFLASEDGVNLLAGYRRAVNIVRIEEKKDKRQYLGEPDPALLSLPEESSLFTTLATAREMIGAELERERFAEAMTVMARLRVPVDAFFDKVTVNADDPRLRENRLLLLSRLRDVLHAVADFSKVEG